MTPARFILALAMLCVAGTVAAYVALQPEGTDATATTKGRSDTLRGTREPHEGSTAKSRPERVSVLIGGVEAPSGDPVLVERAALVEETARRRLAELTGQFQLSRNQQARIFPLLARSSPHYDEALEITGRRGRGLAVPITRRDADREIYDLLDANQQAGFEQAEAEKDLWWSSVIARLERDLRQSAAPSDDAAPPADTAPPADAAPPAGDPPAHRGGNLFDR